ncbi:MAG: hypothetical protein CO065_08115 [Comamonadaceae bacterium CG_4_9_14_0_8_um_filter_57_21]|nr:MAG: hypothetical protein CO065_08115 [Comamonadaceae bacterium CG_4_9_14_0_8_um_filter_57_21]
MSPDPAGLLLDSATSDTQRTLLDAVVVIVIGTVGIVFTVIIVLAVVSIVDRFPPPTAPGVVIGSCDRALG